MVLSRWDDSESRLRLQTAVRLRWFGVAGQLATVSYVYFGLGFNFDIGVCLALIALTAWLNVFFRLRYSMRTRLGTTFATALLAYDIVQLAALLYLTGGIENPFVFLIVAPVTVSAATLPPRNTIALGVLAAAATSLLVFWYRPLPWFTYGGFELPTLYNVGVLASVLAGLIFLALYVWRLAKEARQMSDALAATEMVLAREQQLHALDGLAAAAAHELGTPLSTIAVVAKELARAAPKDGSFAEDIALLQSQAERCREILRKLTREPKEPDPLHARISVRELIEEAAAPYQGFNAEIAISAGAEPGANPAAAREPVGERRPGVIYGLANLVENAVDFARRRVEITATWTAREVVISIADDGPGIPRAGARRPRRALRDDATGPANGRSRRCRAFRHGARVLHCQDAAGALRCGGFAREPRYRRGRRGDRQLAARGFRGRGGERASRERGRNCQWQGRMRIYLGRRASRPIYPDHLYKAWASGGKSL